MSIPALARLLKQSEINDHNELLDAANTSLKTNKNDIQAQHVKVVALLKLDRYDDAVRAVETGGAELKEKAKLEYAYALYKNGKGNEAAKLAKQGNDRGLQHITAQALYSIEDFAGAAELYSSLRSDLSYDNEADLRVNGGAADAQLEFAGHGAAVRQKKPSREDLEAYETAYNAACSSIARGELGQAEVLLKRAKNLCLSLVDLSDAEKTTDTLPMTVQQIYVLAKLGRVEEARKLADEIKAEDIADEITKHLAKINAIAVASDEEHNPYLIQRQVSVEGSLGSSKPFQFQSTVLKRNHFATEIKTLKYEGTASTTQQNINKTPAPTSDSYTNSLSVINAAAHARNSIGKEALKHIVPLLEKRPADVGLILTIVQLYVLTNNANSAIDLLQKFLARLEQSGSADQLDVRFAPALVGSLISLYATNGRKERIRSELAKAAAHWRRKSKNVTGTTHLLKAAGNALLESDEPEDRELAKSIFGELHKQDGEDRYTAAGLLAASPHDSGVDRSVLVTLERLMGGVDAEALENAGIAHKQTVTTQPSKKRAATEDISKKPRKLRKSKMPKDYDPAKTPDPERWLPLRDRSTYRPKGKKGKARQAMLSQGAVSNESSRPATPGGEVLQKKPQPGGGNANKKKKKGKK